METFYEAFFCFLVEIIDSWESNKCRGEFILGREVESNLKKHY